MLQSLAQWCLLYCRDQDNKDMALANVITTAHTSTRLDLDSGPAKGIQHQVSIPPDHLQEGPLVSIPLLSYAQLEIIYLGCCTVHGNLSPL